MSYRVEEKISVSSSKLFDIREWVLKNKGERLFETRTVSSTYFDNESLQMYRDSEEGSTPRKKIRVRSYFKGRHTLADSTLEIKISSVEGRYKSSIKDFNLDKALKHGIYEKDYGICYPIVRVSYSREYYKVYGIRLTIDTNIEYSNIGLNKESSFKITDPENIVEIKAPFNISKDFLDEKFFFQRVRFSKYCRAIDLLKVV